MSTTIIETSMELDGIIQTNYDTVRLTLETTDYHGNDKVVMDLELSDMIEIHEALGRMIVKLESNVKGS